MTVDRVAPVAGCVTLDVTPGSTAPDWSTTMPSMRAGGALGERAGGAGENKRDSKYSNSQTSYGILEERHVDLYRNRALEEPVQGDSIRRTSDACVKNIRDRTLSASGRSLVVTARRSS